MLGAGARGWKRTGLSLESEAESRVYGGVFGNGVQWKHHRLFQILVGSLSLVLSQVMDGRFRWNSGELGSEVCTGTNAVRSFCSVTV